MSKQIGSDFRDLDVWKKCREIRVLIWKLCKKFSSEEKYRLTDQMIRHQGLPQTTLLRATGGFIFRKTFNFAGNLADRFLS